MRLLSTKILSPQFRDRLIQIGCSVVEYPFIKISPLKFELQKIENALIFTSQNAIKQAFKSKNISGQIRNKNCYCVGEKTKSLLEENDQKVIKMSQNASDLAQFIVKKCKNESFSFFCGMQRRPEIELLLGQHNIPLKIHELYETLVTPKHFESPFDGVLFFSPSAVNSYFLENTWPEDTYGFCIGPTTAGTLKTNTMNVLEAKNPSENYLISVIYQHYTQHYA